jgi:hypothetical protein
MSLEEAVDEVLKNIGRNMMLFQQLETLLKYIIANGNISGYINQLEDKKIKLANSVQTKTLGQLVGQYVEGVYGDRTKLSEEDIDINQAHISFRFSIDSGAEYYEAKKANLARLLIERNELVHHLLPQFDTSSVNSCRELNCKLEEQRKRIRHEIKEVRLIATSLQKGRKELANFLGSDEGKRQFNLSYLRQSHLVLLLADIAAQIGREDGWVSMSTAGQFLREHAPDDIASLKERYGYKTLKSLILATKLFDVIDEITSKGGIRVLYRLKSLWAVSYESNVDIDSNAN